MAIQLNDRDHLIFKLIDEHQVLLEKHISYFISGDEKPVLIRDRLRKLFYLDYLLCHRHATKLPWWTTPTKPLVYMLSPIARSVSGLDENNLDLMDALVQRHFLEVANLRMLYMVEEKNARIKDLKWTTTKDMTEECPVDALVNFQCGGVTHRLALVNQAAIAGDLAAKLAKTLANPQIEKIMCISRDDAHRAEWQKIITESKDITDADKKRFLFSTHHELYRSGTVNLLWQTLDKQCPQVFAVDSSAPGTQDWGTGFGVPHAISA